MPLTPKLVDEAVERYWREFDRYKKLAKWVGEACQKLLEEHRIRGLVQWRPKDPDRLRAKLQKYLESGEHASEFRDLDSVFRVLKDLAGARITTYVEVERVRVIALVQERFAGFGQHSEVVAEVKDRPSGFYRATHCMVRLKDVDAVSQYHNLKGIGCEVQVCSQLAHVYHEFEHDLRYKPLSGVLSKKETDLLNALGRLMEVGDTIINQTLDAVAARQGQRLEEDGRAVEESPISYFANPILESLTESPVFLDLARRLQASRPQNDLPESATEFYYEMVRLLASGVLLADDPHVVSARETDAIMATLPAFAWRMVAGAPGVSRYERSNLIDGVARATKFPESDAEMLFDKLVARGLLVASRTEATGQAYGFLHVTIRDFLAANHVASQVNRDGWKKAKVEVGKSKRGRRTIRVCQLIDEQAFEPDWQPIVAFAAGLLNDPVSLLVMLADRSKDDHCRHRLGLLCRCYRALSVERQSEVASSIGFVFGEVLRIAKRCEHDDAGHRRPWLEWVEMLLASSAGAEHLCDGLLELDGRYHGWAVSAKVLELFERVLVRGKVPPPVVDSIADLGLRDEHLWGANTARLALRLAIDAHKETLVTRFVAMLEKPQTPDRVRIRLAEAVATAGHASVSRPAGEKLMAMAQSDSLSFEDSESAVKGMVSLLDTSLAPIAAPLLVEHLLNPASRHHFWLAWRIIGKADREPDNPWSAVFLGITLRADRENDRRLKLWSAQALSKHSEVELGSLGLRTLLAIVSEKQSHSWAHAARWLMENGPAELAEQARAALLTEASNIESGHRLVATAELLEMGAIAPDGGPIREIVRDVVRREIKEHGEKYGSRLHVTAPGAPKGNVDSELFADNPNAVIKLLHSFNGPSFYLRDRDDPIEEKKRMRHWKARLLHGTRFWPEVFRCSLQAVKDEAKPDDDGALGIVLYSASGDTLVELLQRSMRPGRSAAIMRGYLLDELYERGWRLRFRGRRVDVIRRGRDEPLAMMEAE
jgi:ppGpp synthetase/RelA/SpoT-type nucleotidyltranferase